MRKLKGGVFIKPIYTPETAFHFFLANSSYEVLYNRSFITDVTETLLITSSGGLMIKLFLNDGIESPYSMSRPNFYEKPVTEILIKIVFLSDIQTPFRMNGPLTTTDPRTGKIIEIFSSTHQEFQSEVGTQIDIFKKSLERSKSIITGVWHPQGKEIIVSGFEPICPTILYSQQGVSSVDFIQETLARPYRDTVSQFIITYLRGNIATPHLGIVVMECLTDSRTLHDYMVDSSISPADKIIAKNMALYEIIRLYKIGYIHGDIHMHNILITPEYSYFQNGRQGPRGRVHLIDFGHTFLHGQAMTDALLNTTFYYENFIMPSIINTSPRHTKNDHPDTLASTHPHYLWLQSHSRKERHLINLEIRKLHNFRHVVLQLWLLHYKTLRENKVMNWKIPSVTTFYGGNPKNIFDELDPEYKLNERYIEEYIKKEIKFQKEILQSLHRYKSKEYSLKAFGHKLLKTIKMRPSHRTSLISGPAQRNQGGKTKRKTKRNDV